MSKMRTHRDNRLKLNQSSGSYLTRRVASGFGWYGYLKYVNFEKAFFFFYYNCCKRHRVFSPRRNVLNNNIIIILGIGKKKKKRRLNQLSFKRLLWLAGDFFEREREISTVGRLYRRLGIFNLSYT